MRLYLFFSSNCWSATMLPKDRCWGLSVLCVPFGSWSTSPWSSWHFSSMSGSVLPGLFSLRPPITSSVVLYSYIGNTHWTNNNRSKSVLFTTLQGVTWSWSHAEQLPSTLHLYWIDLILILDWFSFDNSLLLNTVYSSTCGLLNLLPWFLLMWTQGPEDFSKCSLPRPHGGGEWMRIPGEFRSVSLSCPSHMGNFFEVSCFSLKI